MNDRKETVNEFYRRHRRPSLSLPSLLESSNGSDNGSNNDAAIQSVQSVSSKELHPEFIDGDKSSADCEISNEECSKQLFADVKMIRSRISKIQSEFRDRIVPPSSNLYDFNQYTSLELKEKQKQAKQVKKPASVNRNWKNAAEVLQQTYNHQQKARTEAQAHRFDDALSFHVNESTVAKRDPIGIALETQISNTTALSVFGEEFNEDDYKAFNRRKSHHHQKHVNDTLHEEDNSHSEVDTFGHSPTDSDSSESETKDSLRKGSKLSRQFSSVSTLEEVRAEQGKIIEAIEEWSELKSRNYGGRYYDAKPKDKPKPPSVKAVPSASELSPLRFSNRISVDDLFSSDEDEDDSAGMFVSGKSTYPAPARASSRGTSSGKYDTARLSPNFSGKYDDYNIKTARMETNPDLYTSESKRINRSIKTSYMDPVAHEGSYMTDEGSTEFCRLDSVGGSSACLDDIVIEAVHEDDVHYRYRGLDDKNYFGEAAKLRFFGKFQQVKANQSKKIISANRKSGKSGGIQFEMDPTKLRLLSPRTRFLTEYVTRFDNPPLPIIIRLTDSNTLDLEDMKLGDDIIILLSKVLNDLPRVTIVNLKNNSLTDKGIHPLIATLSKQAHITELDISNNKIDSLAATALSDMIRAKTCPLRVLKLSTSDLTDSEVSMFTTAFEVNRTITHLDLSRNLLGETESRHDYGKDQSFELLLQTEMNTATAGKSIANALLSNKAITNLDLSWNKIGALATAHLHRALCVTKSIVYLNLAYNNIRDIGAEAMAAALFENSSIRNLDVSYNGITAEGCIYFAAALKVNSAIEKFNISGNPIGDPGGIAIVHCINYHSVNREILLHSCTYPKLYESDTNIPRLTFPTRRFVLNLKLLRDRVVVLELFRLASVRRGYVFKRIEHISTDKKDKGKRTIFVLKRPGNPAELMGHAYYPWTAPTNRSHHAYCRMTADDWVSIVNRLELIDESTGWPWRIPASGTLTIDFVYYPRCAAPIDCLNSTGLHRLITMLIDHRKTVVDLLRLCTQSIAIETDQLAEIMQQLPTSDHPNKDIHSFAFSQQELLEVFVRLLPCVRDACNVDALIQQHYPSAYRKREIQMHLRSIYFVTMGSYSGHYKLDISDSLDRQCAIRLAEIDADENMYLHQKMPSWSSSRNHSYTAQNKFFRTNFRNATFKGAPIILNDEFFSHGLEDLQKGILEFDFISTSRPSIDVKIVGDYDLNGLLVSRGLRGRLFGTQAAMDASLLPKFDDDNREDKTNTIEKQKEPVAEAPVTSPVPSGVQRKQVRRSGVFFSPAAVQSADEALNEAAVAALEGNPSSISSIGNDTPSGGRRLSLIDMLKGKNVSIAGINSSNSAISMLLASKLAAKKSGKSRSSSKSDITPPEAAKDIQIQDSSRKNVDEQETPRLSMGGSLQVSRAAATFLRKFKTMKQRLGAWLFHDKYRNPAALFESLHIQNNFLVKDFTKEGTNLVFNEVTKQDALYYAGDALHRFVVRVAVRIHSSDAKLISRIRARQLKKEEVASQFMSTKATAKGKSGKRVATVVPTSEVLASKSTSKDEDDNQRRRSSNLDDHADIGYYGSVLEACCVWKVVAHPETGQGQLKHCGIHPYPYFVSTQPLEDIPYIKLKPCSLQHGMRSDPTHKKFKLYDDVCISGTEIIIRVKCTHWSSMQKIEEYAKTFINKLFPSYRVRPADIRTSNLVSTEGDEDVFADSKLPKSIQTQVVLHHLDFIVEQIPFARKSLLKIQLSTVDRVGITSMGSLIFGKGKDSFGRLESGSGLKRSLSNAPVDPDIGKMFIVWRWRDIDITDRDACAGEGTAKMELGKRLNELRAATCRVWINCRQAASIINDFPVTSTDGHNYRMEAAVTIFSRVVDLENFNVVVDALPLNYHADLYNKIGWFNAINFFQLSRFVNLDLRIDDNRRLAVCIVTLFVGGGGITLVEQKFRRTYDMDFIPGWEIPTNWDTATYTGNLTPGVPHDGNFIGLIAMKDDSNPEKMERYMKMRQDIHNKYSLLAVPRPDGTDFHLDASHSHYTGENLDWDGLKR